MGKKPLSKIKIQWSSNFAYAIGLITTDGNLSPDGRHISFTSKDKEQIENLMKCLGTRVKIGRKKSGFTDKYSHVVQFGDVNFYKFLCSIGLMPNKSKKLGVIKIPNRYFFDFLRGHLDGDGSFFSYWDKRWKSSFMFYLIFASASKKHIEWLRERISKKLPIKGHVTSDGNNNVFQLKYAKKESLKLLKKLYYSDRNIFLLRKRLKISKALAIIGSVV